MKKEAVSRSGSREFATVLCHKDVRYSVASVANSLTAFIRSLPQTNTGTDVRTRDSLHGAEWQRVDNTRANTPLQLREYGTVQ
jgi:hypothetical protein